jgi:hypothetical protein
MANATPDETTGIDLVSALGSDGGVSTQCLSIYVPNKDKVGREIGNQRKWILEAIQLMTEINGGASAMPPVEGAWQNDEGEVIWENPVVAYSYIRPERFIQSLPRVREFLHRMGRETNQGEIAFEFNERFYRIAKFDAAKRRKA